MSELLSMYEAQANSPSTYTSGALTESQESVVVDDASVLPQAPNLLVLGGDKPYAETVLLLSVDTARNTINIRRGIEGEAFAWPAGTMVARLLTAKEINDISENIRTLNASKAEKEDVQNHAADKAIHVTASDKNKWSSKYSMPQDGIPFDDLSDEVQEVLERTTIVFEADKIVDLPDRTTILQYVLSGAFPIVRAPSADSQDKLFYVYSGFDEASGALYFTSISNNTVLLVLRLSDAWDAYSIDLGKVPSHKHTISDISNFPSTMPPSTHSHAASTITAGTLAGKVVANSSAQEKLNQTQVRNITISTTDIGAGANLELGSLYIVYEE